MSTAELFEKVITRLTKAYAEKSAAEAEEEVKTPFRRRSTTRRPSNFENLSVLTKGESNSPTIRPSLFKKGPRGPAKDVESRPLTPLTPLTPLKKSSIFNEMSPLQKPIATEESRQTTVASIDESFLKPDEIAEEAAEKATLSEMLERQKKNQAEIANMIAPCKKTLSQIEESQKYLMEILAQF